MEIFTYILYALLVCLAVVLIYVLCIVAVSLTVDLSKPIEKQSRFCRRAIAVVIPVFIRLCGERPVIKGREKMPEGKFLMVCNHRSMFDPLTVMSEFKDYNIGYVSKPENLRLPVVGPIAYGAGTLGIDRENNREALKTVLRAAQHIKSGICNMAIYPEGTRSRDGKLLPFHSGSFKIAQKAGCDLVICSIEGSEKVAKRLFLPTKVTLTVLETLPAEKVMAANTDQLADYSRRLISRSLGLED